MGCHPPPPLPEVEVVLETEIDTDTDCELWGVVICLEGWAALCDGSCGYMSS
jgi:hypothetical protein